MATQKIDHDRLVEVIMEYGEQHPDNGATNFQFDFSDSFCFDGSLVLDKIKVRASTKEGNIAFTVNNDIRSFGPISCSSGWLIFEKISIPLNVIKNPLLRMNICWQNKSINFECFDVELVVHPWSEGTLDIRGSQGFTFSAHTSINPDNMDGFRYDRSPLVWVIAEKIHPVKAKSPTKEERQNNDDWSATNVMNFIESTGYVGMSLFGMGDQTSAIKSSKQNRSQEQPSQKKTPVEATVTPVNISTVKTSNMWDSEDSVAQVQRDRMVSIIDQADQVELLADLDEDCATLQVWRLDKADIVRDERAERGRFRDRCTYIVYHKDISDLHYWQGSFALKDQIAVSAFKATSFAKALRANGVKIDKVRRQVQGAEDDDFVVLFDGSRDGLRYESAFGAGQSSLTVASKSKDRMHLYRVVAERLVEVELVRSSLDSNYNYLMYGDGGNIFVFFGTFTSQLSRAQSSELGRIKRAEHGSGMVVTLHEKEIDIYPDFLSHFPPVLELSKQEEGEMPSLVVPKGSEKIGLFGALDMLIDGSIDLIHRELLSSSLLNVEEAVIEAEINKAVESLGLSFYSGGRQNLISSVNASSSSDSSANQEAETADSSFTVVLYRIGFIAGQLEVCDISAVSGVLERQMLATSGVFILDLVSEVVVWIGRSSGVESRVAGAEVAKRMVIGEHAVGRPSWASYSQVGEGREPLHFKSMFQGWVEEDRLDKIKKMDSRRLSDRLKFGLLDSSAELDATRRASLKQNENKTVSMKDIEDLKKRRVASTVLSLTALSWRGDDAEVASLQNTVGAAMKHTKQKLVVDQMEQRLLNDEGKGVTATWMIENGDLIPVMEDEGYFYSDKTYITLYITNNDEEEQEEEEEVEDNAYDLENCFTSLSPQTGELMSSDFAIELQKMRNRLKKKSKLVQGGVSVIYMWRGEASRSGDLTMWQMGLRNKFYQMWQEVAGKFAPPLPIIEVHQRLEPLHFLRIFNGRLILRLRQSFINKEKEEDDRVLLQVRHGIAAQVSTPCTTLNPCDVYLLLQETTSTEHSSLWVWVGGETSSFDQANGSAIAARLAELHGVSSDENQIRIATESKDRDEKSIWSIQSEEEFFLQAAQGRATTSDIIEWNKNPVTAFSVTPLETNITSEPNMPLFSFKGVQLLQMHCNEKTLLIVEGASNIYLWVGRLVSDQDENNAFDVTKNWMEATKPKCYKSRDRSSTVLRTFSFDPGAASSIASNNNTEGQGIDINDVDGDIEPPQTVIKVYQSEEPPEFVALFHGWSDWDHFHRPVLVDPWHARLESRAKEGVQTIALGKVVVENEAAEITTKTVSLVDDSNGNDRRDTRRSREKKKRASSKSRRARSRSVPSAVRNLANGSA